MESFGGAREVQLLGHRHSLVDGANSAGHDAHLVNLNDRINGLLRDCRQCRGADGQCGIDDRYAELILDEVARADALVYATPLYWYGMAASLKTFFDRLVCYVSAGFPDAAGVIGNLRGKRIALLISSEESYPTACSAVITQIQEMSRYLHQEFVASINGVGNHRGEVRLDPTEPLRAARNLGAHLFDMHHSDYTITTSRGNHVWVDS
jgi:multimeric flavodoxin WrbA